MSRWPAALDASAVFSKSKLTTTTQARRSFAAELVSHLKQYGFARVRNHGVTPVAIKGLFKYHRDFFALPLSSKLTVRHPGGESPARGYSPWAYEKTAVLRPDLHSPTDPARDSLGAHSTRNETGHFSSKMLLDAREQFAVGPPSDVAYPTPRLAEAILPGFDQATRSAHAEISQTCRALVDAIEEGLGAPRDSISGPTEGGRGAELNLNFYPEVERDALENSATSDSCDESVAMRRIWPHSDLGVISALFQDGVGASGLELQWRGPLENEFAPVAIEQEGDLVLLVSDTLERWTNGQLRAAVHRVGTPPVSPTGSSGAHHVPERRSAVMFFRAPPTADLGPLPCFVSKADPAKYEHVTAGEYLKRHNKRLY
ncbi:Clavaminate synthase-like protein [Xylariaceae sp. FL0016]|nr:Clavaminate synthase-like protein [Xylariaceae sp. FL0016]